MISIACTSDLFGDKFDDRFNNGIKNFGHIFATLILSIEISGKSSDWIGTYSVILISPSSIPILGLG